MNRNAIISNSYFKMPHIIMTLVFWALIPIYGHSAAFSEYKIKAAFLYNFTKFVDWPESQDKDSSQYFIIGILGKDPFKDGINIIKGKMAKGRPIRIEHYTTINEIRHCDILFISPSVQYPLPVILDQLKGQTVLTIGDTNGFAQKGIIINLYTDGNKVRFEINHQAAQQAGLRISSHLLRLSKIIEPSAMEKGY